MRTKICVCDGVALLVILNTIFSLCAALRSDAIQLGTKRNVKRANTLHIKYFNRTKAVVVHNKNTRKEFRSLCLTASECIFLLISFFCLFCPQLYIMPMAVCKERMRITKNNHSIYRWIRVCACALAKGKEQVI